MCVLSCVCMCASSVCPCARATNGVNGSPTRCSYNCVSCLSTQNVLRQIVKNCKIQPPSLYLSLPLFPATFLFLFTPSYSWPLLLRVLSLYQTQCSLHPLPDLIIPRRQAAARKGYINCYILKFASNSKTQFYRAQSFSFKLHFFKLQLNSCQSQRIG